MGQLTVETILVASASGQQNLTGFPTGGSIQSLYFLLIFLAIIVTLRIYRGINGRAYSTARVLRVPVIYVVLTLVTVLAVGTFEPVLVATLALIPGGFLLGYRFATKVTFFNINNRVYYKRSPAVLIIWLISFVIRIVLEAAIAPSVTIDFIVDVILCTTTGIFIGEAINVVRMRKNYSGTDNRQPFQDDGIKTNQ